MIDQGGSFFHILIADDEAIASELLRRMLERLLDDLNLKIIEVEDGQKAIDMLPFKKFNIVFIDLQMPLKDGFEVMANIFKVEENSRPIVVIISGRDLYSDDFVVEFEEKIGTKISEFGKKIHLLKKPLRLDNLECILKQCVACSA